MPPTEYDSLWWAALKQVLHVITWLICVGISWALLAYLDNPSSVLPLRGSRVFTWKKRKRIDPFQRGRKP